MKPAASIIIFTTVAGAAQGLAVTVAAASLAGVPPQGDAPFMLWVACLMLIVGLAASFFHLGHPLRAWRAMLMWRTSWMSREVIVLPAFIALVAAWALAARTSGTPPWLAVLAIAAAVLLWYCTAMIYACIRFIQEWAHPLTWINYMLLGLCSGIVLSGALATLAGDQAFAHLVAPWAIASTCIAWLARAASLRRNARLKPKSSTQSATGIQHARVVQKAMGMTGGSFNTREFFHGATPAFMRAAKPGFQLLAFAAPIALLVWAMATGWSGAWLVAALLQMAGMLAERWFFFAQAQHPQNIYYQVIS